MTKETDSESEILNSEESLSMFYVPILYSPTINNRIQGFNSDCETGCISTCFLQSGHACQNTYAHSDRDAAYFGLRGNMWEFSVLLVLASIVCIQASLRFDLCP